LAIFRHIIAFSFISHYAIIFIFHYAFAIIAAISITLLRRH